MKANVITKVYASGDDDNSIVTVRLADGISEEVICLSVGDIEEACLTSEEAKSVADALYYHADRLPPSPLTRFAEFSEEMGVS